MSSNRLKALHFTSLQSPMRSVLNIKEEQEKERFSILELIYILMVSQIARNRRPKVITQSKQMKKPIQMIFGHFEMIEF